MAAQAIEKRPGIAQTIRGRTKGCSPMPRKTLEDRFWEKVDRQGPDDCWEWQGGTAGKGYGRFYVDGRSRPSHQIAYELDGGTIPEGFQMDHLCRNPLCVNPAHLEPVTPLENTRRGNAGKHTREKTHCPKGHPYAGDNLIINSKGHRECRACWRARQRRRDAALKVARKQRGRPR